MKQMVMPNGAKVDVDAGALRELARDAYGPLAAYAAKSGDEELTTVAFLGEAKGAALKALPCIYDALARVDKTVHVHVAAFPGVRATVESDNMHANILGALAHLEAAVGAVSSERTVHDACGCYRSFATPVTRGPECSGSYRDVKRELRERDVQEYAVHARRAVTLLHKALGEF